MSVFNDLKRRQVIKVMVAYAIMSWLIVQIASVMVPALILPDWVLSLVAFLLIIGFPVAVFLAWAYELTPDGIQRTSDSELPTSVRRITGRRLNFAIIGLLAAALAYVLVDRVTDISPQREDGQVSSSQSRAVAVLPFVSMSSDPEQQYFADGISEELLNILARIPGLHVPSRTSSFSFRGSSVPLETIASELAVEHVLEGSVRRDGDRVRIVVQLIDTSSNQSVWTESFDREMTNLFDIQDEIATRVAEILQVRLLGDRESGLSRTTNPEAHIEYLRGLALVATNGSSDVLEAIDSFGRAIEIDPQYAAAYAMLANAYYVADVFDFMPSEEARRGAANAVNRALEIDPLLARAYFERSRLADNIEAQLADLQRAVDLGLNDASAHLSRSQVLATLGQHSAARNALEQAARIDSRNVMLNWMMGSLRLNLGDRNGARGYYQRSIDLQPDSPNAYAGMGDVATVEGRIDEAIRWYVSGLQQDPGHPHMSTWVGFLYLTLGDEARAETWLSRGAALLQSHGTGSEFIRDFVPLVLRGEDPARLMALVREVSPEFFGPFGSRIFRKAVVSTGLLPEIRSYYADLWPELFASEPEIDVSNFEIIPDVVWILRSELVDNRTISMLNEALAISRSTEWASMYPSDMTSSLTEVELLVLLGRDEEALELLSRRIDTGWRFGWWQFDTDPLLEGIRDRPGFAEAFARVRADMARQLREMPDYWPPVSND